MTDPITCPACDGTGHTTLGPLNLKCGFCHGAGHVGGDNEPADPPRHTPDGWHAPRDGEAYDPDIHGPLPGVHTHPAVTASGLCPQCLDTGVIVTIGGMRPGYHAPIESPCPRCTAGT